MSRFTNDADLFYLNI